jgi:hypothetical protein
VIQRILLTFPAFFLVSNLACATELSGGLVKDDIKVAIKKLAWGSAHRAWTATAEEDDQPLGLDVGVDATFFSRGRLLKMGDGAGVVPSVIPVPRIWLGWDLPKDIDVSFDFGPGWAFDGVTTYGGSGQWTFYKDVVAASAVFAYTYANAFGDLKTHTIDVAAQVAKDLEVWHPYAGLGLMNSYGKISRARIAPGNKRNWEEVLGVHGYVGFMAYLPAKVGFQFDFVNRQPSIAFLLAHQF